jgi:hypothetical protein
MKSNFSPVKLDESFVETHDAVHTKMELQAYSVRLVMVYVELAVAEA